ncbi:tetratricopeptide repeat protein [Novosphingobium mangrovi (ex Huang et al. 2023)]|uniref:Tetratricopeptide repeat protein n=1 Tax=Novosphingobium mangrovi (ex Huang et al. 2023) TaxID=2976432 RepID=A0ABT2I4J8_9SPHN|nr:tetratricopeptide repeat protein [Novosphingobium mangrovi (ex Huang et al. 2023)]MCT2399738.1 tetratricopeptide repeat protein [Novosphingobium mangrovi (ex Huang et al. 2023)]
MERFNTHARTAGLTVCTAMAAVLLAGCASQMPIASSGQPAVSPESADAQLDLRVAKAEQRVAKSPRDASDRVDLAQSYLAAGRFDAAASSFQDAISLGEDNARIGLGLALAYIGTGRNAEAMTVLARWRNDIPVSDLGLAIALAGQPSQGVALLSDAVRGGESDAKTRQNLAYAYALSGRWAEARVIASQDVPADRLDARMGEWAARIRPEQYQMRVAALLGAPVRADVGQPAALTLADSASSVAVTETPAPVAAAELPAVAEDAPVEKVAANTVPAAPADDRHVHEATLARDEDTAPVAASLATSAAEAPQAASVKFVSQPQVQPLGEARSAYVEAPAKGTHLVQLGSFRSLEGAKRAWGIFVARNPALKDHKMRITEADVRGQRYFRVAAEGFDRSAARSLCSSVRERGDGCFAYVKTRALPGAVPGSAQTGAMLAKL